MGVVTSGRALWGGALRGEVRWELKGRVLLSGKIVQLSGQPGFLPLRAALRDTKYFGTMHFLARAPGLRLARVCHLARRRPRKNL